MAQAVAYGFAHDKLFHLHINDNYGSWDDDMIVGSVHSAEFVELFYLLRQSGYRGYVSVDIFPYRENGYRALEESIQYMKKFDDLASSIDPRALKIMMDSEDMPGVIKMLRETMYK